MFVVFLFAVAAIVGLAVLVIAGIRMLDQFTQAANGLVWGTSDPAEVTRRRARHFAEYDAARDAR